MIDHTLPPIPEDATLDDSVLAGMGSGYEGIFISFEGLDGCGKRDLPPENCRSSAFLLYHKYMPLSKLYQHLGLVYRIFLL